MEEQRDAAPLVLLGGDQTIEPVVHVGRVVL
jgi:hypothetical protein